jgi:hypothetical protein
VYGWDVVRDAREEFVERVKAIDPIFKRGDLEAFWPMLRALMSMAPDRADLAKKKSHYLASLAVRSLARGEAESSLGFLDYADRILDPRALSRFLLEERQDIRHRVVDALRGHSPSVG